MNNLSDNFLSLADRSTRRFGFINSAMAAITNKIVPQVTAAACGSAGTETCYYYCGGPCGSGSGGIARIRVYASSYNSCLQCYTFECVAGCPSMCAE